MGGGPVGCLLARELRKRAIEVEVYERGSDPRKPGRGRGHSFNLTLTLRGLNTLDPELRNTLYEHGVPCQRRIIHHKDGSITSQPYGAVSEHHLLSIPRGLLHRLLLTEAEVAGAGIYFGRECIRADPRNARAAFVDEGRTVCEVEGDLLVGCDGASSVVRHEMSKTGARIEVHQEFIRHGFIELHMPSGPAQEQALYGDTPQEVQPGLHVWPRGEFMLIAQPNRDNTHTTTLFMPLDAGESARPGLRQLTTAASVDAFFYQHFFDVRPLLPDLTRDFFAAAPASLRVVRCDPFHYGRAVLLGDAAHTMAPFFGQGINCSFEDVQTFFELWDRALRRGKPEDAVLNTLADFTAARKGPGNAITSLSQAHLEELSSHTAASEYHTRKRIERRLHELYPDRFAPLYQRVAFSNIPYDLALDLYERDVALLNELLGRFDPAIEEDEICQAFGEHLGINCRTVAGVR